MLRQQHIDNYVSFYPSSSLRSRNALALKIKNGEKPIAHAGEASVSYPYIFFRRVLLATYLEYLALLWAPSLRRLMRRGVVFGAVVHDPVRDYIVGPCGGTNGRLLKDTRFYARRLFTRDVDLGLARQNVRTCGKRLFPMDLMT